MKINKYPFALSGFLIQTLLFLPVANRLMMVRENYLAYLVLTVLVAVYNLFYGFKNSPKGIFRLTFITTFLALLICGLLFPAPERSLLLLLIYGILTGLLAGIILYHFVRIVFAGYRAAGYHFVLESTLSFFAPTGFIALLLSSASSTQLLLMLAILLAISCFISTIIFISLNAIVIQLKQGITEKSPQTIYLNILPSLKNLYETFREFFVRTGTSMEEIENLSKEIRNSAEDLSSASEEMNASLQEVSSTVQHIAKGAQDQSEAITAIARSIEELDNLTTSISSQVKMANVSSRRTTESAKKGLEFTSQQAKILRDIFEQTRYIEEKMAKLREQATEIKKIVDIIRGITEQTDLLALNAAIEAARVGEQGKGFAVVADEIRNLANETQRSSTIVENLIFEINKTTQELNNLLNLEREKIDEANISASQTEEEFTGIVKAVNLVTDMVGRINEAAANQLSHTKELVKKVEQVAQVAADTAAATEEVSAAVEEQTASMEQFTSTAQLLTQIVVKLNTIISDLKK
ncbi:MAG: methyl-accepting chemotaxis protein [candidate division WOR-3 bacterium]|nr:methyl-accepting chemotaxis protein [candidate division WOR-3 bacterium]